MGEMLPPSYNLEIQLGMKIKPTDNMECGSITYTVRYKLEDRAGNVSAFSPSISVTTQDCGYCTTTGNGRLLNPIRNGVGIPTGLFPKYQEFSGNIHAGYDLAAPNGTTVKAATSGKVIKAVFGYTNDYAKSWEQLSLIPIADGWGNYVVLEHDNFDGTNQLITIYAHLKNTQVVSVGDILTPDSTLGFVGSTGRSQGNHLHFQTELQGANFTIPDHQTRTFRYPPIDPRKLLGNIGTNYTPEEYTIACNAPIFETGGDTDINLPDVNLLKAKTAVALYIRDYLDDDSQIENHKTNQNPNDTYTTKNQLYKFGIDKNNLNDPTEFNKLVDFVDVNQTHQNLWVQHLGKGKGKHPTNPDPNQYLPFDDGAIIVDNYAVTKVLLPFEPQPYTAHLIKNGIWSKYRESPQKDLGVPTKEEYKLTESERSNYSTTNQTISTYYQQNFRQSKYQHNQIHFYTLGGCTARPPSPGLPAYSCNQGTHSYYIIGKVGDRYINQTSEYKTPVEDTRTLGREGHCRQKFINKYILACTDITELLNEAKRLTDSGQVFSIDYDAIVNELGNVSETITLFDILNNTRYIDVNGNEVLLTAEDWVKVINGTSTVDRNSVAIIEKAGKFTKSLQKIGDLFDRFNFFYNVLKDGSQLNQNLENGIFPATETVAFVASLYAGRGASWALTAGCLATFGIATAGIGAVGCAIVGVLGGVMVGAFVEEKVEYLFTEVLTRDNFERVKQDIERAYYTLYGFYPYRYPTETLDEYISRISCAYNPIKCY